MKSNDCLDLLNSLLNDSEKSNSESEVFKMRIEVLKEIKSLVSPVLKVSANTIFDCDGIVLCCTSNFFNKCLLLKEITSVKNSILFNNCINPIYYNEATFLNFVKLISNGKIKKNHLYSSNI